MTLTQALDAYRDAVVRRARWEEAGTRRDGHLEAAQDAERTARSNLRRVIGQRIVEAERDERALCATEES